MIQAQEFRVGNSIKSINGRLPYWEVQPIDIPFLFANPERYEAIPLTEECLLKFGFEKKGCNWELPNFRFHVNKSVNYDGFLFCDGYSVITEKIQHVHQLQNLYFALTYKELAL